ncbi:hypothetical protein L1049_000106 [Liquidambar formosana]|uniref:Late embryogenesis abundant protein LEA-2 subgroup domain-containing protein n=1 Tax=Liquidambar formosana TaxID=63359 RepID=A0AAP0N9Z7_LIQFO
MLALPPPPPPPPLPPAPAPAPSPAPPQKETMSLHNTSPQVLALPPSAQKETMSTPLNQIVISKQSMNQHTPTLHRRDPSTSKSKKAPILPQPRRTNPIIWCSSILCLIFSLILIFFGIATLIIFLVIKPRTPSVDIPSASLSAIYFDSPEYFNGDFTFLANFTNPNRKIDVRFEYLAIELYFFDKLIATQALQPFTQRPRETRLESVHLISSLVYLPSNLAVELQKQVQSNSIMYSIRGTFRVRATLGLTHFSYWLHSRCQLKMTGPPTGVLAARSCKTKR